LCYRLSLPFPGGKTFLFPFYLLQLYKWSKKIHYNIFEQSQFNQSFILGLTEWLLEKSNSHSRNRKNWFGELQMIKKCLGSSHLSSCHWAVAIWAVGIWAVAIWAVNPFSPQLSFPHVLINFSWQWFSYRTKRLKKVLMRNQSTVRNSECC